MVLRSTRSGVLVLAACLLADPAGGQTATAPIASVESRWDDVYCDLLEVTPHQADRAQREAGRIGRSGRTGEEPAGRDPRAQVTADHDRVVP